MAGGRRRDEPRISVNKLGEYLIATPARRRRLIQEQKYPPTYQVIYYEDASNAICSYLTNPARSDRQLLDEIDRLSVAIPSSDGEEQRNRSCIEALEAFLEVCDSIDLHGCRAVAGDSNPRKLAVGGVEVSVRPEILLYHQDGSLAGAIKVYLSKGKPLDKAAAEYIATMVHQYTELVLDSSCPANRCSVIDVFAGHRQTAPKSVKRRREDIAAACEEIASRWAFV